MKSCKITCLLLLLCSLQITLLTQTISQFCDPQRNGIYSGTNLLKSWPETVPALAWRFDGSRKMKLISSFILPAGEKEFFTIPFIAGGTLYIRHGNSIFSL